MYLLRVLIGCFDWFSVLSVIILVLRHSIENRSTSSFNEKKRYSARALKKMAAFSLRLDLVIEVNRHFFENEYSDQSFFSVVLN